MLRKSILITLFILAKCQNGKCGHLRYLEDLRLCRNFNEAQLVSHFDSLTLGGGGVFVYVHNDLRAEIFGLLIKSNIDGYPGSWIRQDAFRLHPDWFGARHIATVGIKPPTFRELGYNEEDVKRRYYRHIPDISLDDTPDFAALQMTFKAMDHGYYTADLGPADYFINRTLTLPQTPRFSTTTHYIINGNGALITSIHKEGFTFLETMPADQKQGLNIFTDRRFRIRDLVLRGQSPPGSGTTGIRIGATFHSLIENVHFSYMDTGIVLRHAMSTIISQCNALFCYKVGFYIGSGTWPGSTGPTSGSNQTKVISSRMFAWPGQYAGIIINKSSECSVIDFTMDGGENRSTDFGIVINTGGLTVVKDGFVDGVHGECAVDSAFIKFRGGGNALFEVRDMYIQMPGTIVELETTYGGAQVKCENFSYFPPSSDFANKGNGNWIFNEAFERNQIVRWKTGDGYSAPPADKIKNNRKSM
jgi:hypothetical protein